MKIASSALLLIALSQAAGEPVRCVHAASGARAPYAAERAAAAWEAAIARATETSVAGYRATAVPPSAHEAGFAPFDSGLQAGHVTLERRAISWSPPAAWIGRTLVFASAARLSEGLPAGAIGVVTRARTAAELRRAIELAEEPLLWATPELIAAFGVRLDETAVTIHDSRTIEAARY